MEPSRAAILSAPDDDAPRLAFADAIERVDGARAELIRAQCELGRLSFDDARTVPLRLREQALIAKHHARWLKVLKPSAVHAWLARGFFEQVRVHGKKFVADAGAIFANEPIRSLWSRDVGNKLVGEFAAIPHLARLHTLSLPECKLDAKGLALLLASPHLTALRALKLAYNALRGRAPIERLVAWEGVTTLEELALGSNRFADDDLVPLLASTRPRALRSLSLNGTLIGLDGMGVLRNHLALPALRQLSLDGCRLEGEDVRVLRDCTALGQLRELNIGGNTLDGLGMSALAAGPWASTLESLSTSQPEQVRCALDALAAPGALPALRRLSFWSPRLDAANVEALARRDWPLRELTLRGPLTPAMVASLASSGLRTSLERLELVCYEPLAADVVTALLEHEWPKLCALRVQSHVLPYALAERIVAEQRFPVLRALSMATDSSAARALPDVAAS
jgi:uncharacterized protein (TIGR02996 family)